MPYYAQNSSHTIVCFRSIWVFRAFRSKYFFEALPAKSIFVKNY